jgi:membrane fusion protein (multidrug efflux system)
VEVRGGLKAGDRVVADGLNRIQDGQPLRVGGGRPGGAAPVAGAQRAPR